MSMDSDALKLEWHRWLSERKDPEGLCEDLSGNPQYHIEARGTGRQGPGVQTANTEHRAEC